MADQLPFKRKRKARAPEADAEADECEGCGEVFPIGELHYDVEDCSPLCDECYEDCPVVDDDADY